MINEKTNPLNFLVYSNLFIAGCAVLMVYQTCDLLLGEPPGWSTTAFIFCATICSYSFHWWLTPVIDLPSARLTWIRRNRWVHLVFFFAGLVGAVYYGIVLATHWRWLLLSAFITFLYSAPKIPHPWFRILRKIALGKTIFLAFVWMYVTTLLPLQLSGKPWRTDFYFFAASRFFLIYAICILFDHRDRHYDRSIGIRSLVTWLSERGIALLFACSLLLFTVATLLLLRYDYSWITIVILLVPGLIAALLYRYATRNSSDMLYYFLLDGLMAVSAVLTLLTGT